MKPHPLHPVPLENIDAPHFAQAGVDFASEEELYLRHLGRVRLRPIRPSDEPRMVKLHESLSEEAVYLRFFEHISLDTRTLHERLARVCRNTAESYAIVAELHSPKHPTEPIVAIGRLTTTAEPGVAAFALLCTDEAQESCLPGNLLSRLIDTARAFGFHTLTGDQLVADHETINLCRGFDFNLRTIPGEGIVRATRQL